MKLELPGTVQTQRCLAEPASELSSNPCPIQTPSSRQAERATNAPPRDDRVGPLQSWSRKRRTRRLSPTGTLPLPSSALAHSFLHLLSDDATGPRSRCYAGLRRDLSLAFRSEAMVDRGSSALQAALWSGGGIPPASQMPMSTSDPERGHCFSCRCRLPAHVCPTSQFTTENSNLSD